jgi:hypothetical protein
MPREERWQDYFAIRRDCLVVSEANATTTFRRRTGCIDILLRESHSRGRRFGKPLARVWTTGNHSVAGRMTTKSTPRRGLKVRRRLHGRSVTCVTASCLSVRQLAQCFRPCGARAAARAPLRERMSISDFGYLVETIDGTKRAARVASLSRMSVPAPAQGFWNELPGPRSRRAIARRNERNEDSSCM